jgi:hypothetical protein
MKIVSIMSVSRLQTNCVLCDIETKYLRYIPPNLPAGITQNLFGQFDTGLWDPPILSGVIKGQGCGIGA